MKRACLCEKNLLFFNVIHCEIHHIITHGNKLNVWRAHRHTSTNTQTTPYTFDIPLLCTVLIIFVYCISLVLVYFLYFSTCETCRPCIFHKQLCIKLGTHRYTGAMHLNYFPCENSILFLFLLVVFFINVAAMQWDWLDS